MMPAKRSRNSGLNLSEVITGVHPSNLSALSIGCHAGTAAATGASTNQNREQKDYLANEPGFS